MIEPKLDAKSSQEHCAHRRRTTPARTVLRLLAVPLVTAGAVAALPPVTASAGAQAAAAAQPCAPVSGVPPFSPPVTHLSSVAVLTACSAFAATDGTTVLRYDGANWNPQQLPTPTRTGADLTAISGLSPASVWIAGDYSPAAGESAQPLIEHWDGSAWSISIPPAVPTGGAVLGDIDASSATDAWAVGTWDKGTTVVFLADRWNGTTWTQIPGADPTSDTQPLGVADISPTDAWMVGNSFSGADHVSTALIEHWDGTSWTVAPSPALPEGSVLSGVSALSAADVWAVGSSGPEDAATTVIEHYDGTSWTVVPGPSPAPSSVLTGVAVTSTGGIATGTMVDAHGDRQLLMARLDGTTWTQVPAPHPGPDPAVSIDGTSNNYWAVGGYRSNGSFAPIAIRCC